MAYLCEFCWLMLNTWCMICLIGLPPCYHGYWGEWLWERECASKNSVLMGRGLLQGAGVNNDNQRWWFWIASYVRDFSSDASASKKPRPNISLTTPYFDCCPSPQFSSMVIDHLYSYWSFCVLTEREKFIGNNHNNAMVMITPLLCSFRNVKHEKSVNTGDCYDPQSLWES